MYTQFTMIPHSVRELPCGHTVRATGLRSLHRLFLSIQFPLLHPQFSPSYSVPPFLPMSWMICFRPTHLPFHTYSFNLPTDILFTCPYNLNRFLFTNLTTSQFTSSVLFVKAYLSYTSIFSTLPTYIMCLLLQCSFLAKGKFISLSSIFLYQNMSSESQLSNFLGRGEDLNKSLSCSNILYCIAILLNSVSAAS